MLRPRPQPRPLHPAVCLGSATSSPGRPSPAPALGTGLGALSPWSTTSWGLCLSNLSAPTAALPLPPRSDSGSLPASSLSHSPRCRELSRRPSPHHLPAAGLHASPIGPMSTRLRGHRSPSSATLRGRQRGVEPGRAAWGACLPVWVGSHGLQSCRLFTGTCNKHP